MAAIVGVCAVGRAKVGARRAGEVVEAEAEHDGAADPSRPSHPACDAVDEREQDRVDLLRRPRGAPAEGALGADRAAPATRLHGPRVVVVRERVQVASRPGPSMATSAPRPSFATSPTVR